MDKPTVDFYNSHAARLAQRYDHAQVDSLHALLRRWIPLGSQVLEIGCGSGRDARFLADLGCRVTATDASDELLTHAKTLSSSPTNPEYLQRMYPLAPTDPLLQRKFDVVLAIAVLMHIPAQELDAFYTNLRMLTRPGGLAIFSVRDGTAEAASDEDDPRLYVHRDIASIQRDFESHGFSLLQQNRYADGLGRASIAWEILVLQG
jgi:2-polyprenyl-3-methyl-5-hydroxy-6-metoxy-1,4-benzoquinol methylase